jgi:hypothetical protein
MNKLQKAALIVVLILDVAMLLYPPYTIGFGFHSRNIGHHLLFASYGDINFVTLAAQITIVSIIGLIVFILAKHSGNE